MKGIAFLSGFMGILITFGNLPVKAQITSDGTTNTTVNSTNNNFNILNGIQKGNNLFHSFSEFSIPTGGSVNFNNSTDVVNIINRVTGGNISNIDGLIKAQGNANLFLINPAGIIFGENASLDIGGSFLGSTAESILFEDGLEFSAVNAESEPLLTVSVPLGLQMVNSTSEIQVRGQGNDSIVPTNNLGISPSPGKTIALVGGNVTFTGGVITGFAGRIEVGAVGSGTVNMIPTPTAWQLDYTQVKNFGDINFTQRSSLWNPDPVGNPVGGIQIIGRDIALDQSQIVAATSGTVQGSNITVNAQRSLSLGGINTQAQVPSAWIANQVAPGATGNGGAIKIQAGDLTLGDGAAIETFSLGAGAAGKVEVIADTITANGVIPLQSSLFAFSNSNSRIASQVYGSGNGGDVSLVVKNLTLKNGGSVTTSVFPGATGQGGNISVDVADEMYALGVNPIGFLSSGIVSTTFGIGDSGNIQVYADKLNLIDGGTITTITSRLRGIPDTGIGNAGDIKLVVTESSNLVRVSPISPIQNSFVGSLSTSSGNTGNVSLTTPILSMKDGASLGVSTVPVIGGLGDPNQVGNLGSNGSIHLNVSDRLTVAGFNPFTGSGTIINTINYGSATPRDVTITTNQLQVLNGGVIANTTLGTGDAGTLNIQSNDILIDGQNIGGAAIFANAPIVDQATRQLFHLPESPTGNTGAININTHHLTVRNGANISVTHQGMGDAGEVNIQANQVFLNAGQITATTASGEGGNINLQLANTLLSRGQSQINVEAGSNGDGGNINIDAPVIVGLENSDIVANAVQGNGGNINITTQGIFGLKFRNELTEESDITASSQFGVNGTVEINNVNIDPNSGLVELPTELTDSSQQIASGCSSNTDSSFIATGRGGIPQNPHERIDVNSTWSDIRDLSAFSKRDNNIQNTEISNQRKIVEATGFIRNTKGEIELVALENTPLATKQIADCSGMNT